MLHVLCVVLVFFTGWVISANPPHVVAGAVLFFGCAYAVFSPRFDDGVIGRPLFTVCAIAGACYAYGGEPRALLTSYVLLLVAFMWVTLRDVIWLARD